MDVTYDAEFFNVQARQSEPAAALIAIVIQVVINAKSVVDIGGGVGAFAAAFAYNGAEDHLVVDGDYVDRGQLLVPPERFVAADLTQPLDLGRRFDVALCLEVAEHLPEDTADVLLDTLERHSDVIVFSAAVPGQTGSHHVNEKPQSWWHLKFRERGFKAFDLVRPALWHDDRVAWWYLQNTLVYARGAVAQSLGPEANGLIDALHPRFLQFREELARQQHSTGLRRWLPVRRRRAG